MLRARCSGSGPPPPPGDGPGHPGVPAGRPHQRADTSSPWQPIGPQHGHHPGPERAQEGGAQAARAQGLVSEHREGSVGVGVSACPSLTARPLEQGLLAFPVKGQRANLFDLEDREGSTTRFNPALGAGKQPQMA